MRATSAILPTLHVHLLSETLLVKFSKTALSLAAGTLMFGGNAMAQTDLGDETVTDQAAAIGGAVFTGWTGTASLGATFASGNASSDNINGSLRLIKSYERWDHVLTASLFKGSSTVLVTERDANNDIVTDENGFPVREIVEGENSDRLAFGYQPKYYFSQKLYAFGILDWETDEPANIDTASRQIIGAGYSFYRNASGYLSGEAGFGNKVLNPVFGDDLDGAIAYLGLNYLNRITDTVTLNADVRADIGGDNTFIELGLGAAFKLSDRFSLKVTHFSRSNTDLEDPTNPEASSTDSITAFNLVMDI